MHLVLKLEWAKDGSCKMRRYEDGHLESTIYEDVMNVPQRLQDHKDLGYKFLIVKNVDEATEDTFCPVDRLDEASEERE